MKRLLSRLSRVAAKASLHGGARVPEGHIPVCVGKEGALRISCPVADFNKLLLQLSPRPPPPTRRRSTTTRCPSASTSPLPGRPPASATEGFYDEHEETVVVWDRGHLDGATESA
jgi:hypothetical protein